jgi:hypothetical protein
MQGIAALPYEVYELPMVPEGGIQQYEQAADMLAEFGRNGDTYIVHAAEGETMVPMEVLDNNPRLKKMLFSQMEEMGIEPDRYIVGNELNSINPVTGQPEFFLRKAFRKIGRAVKKVGKKVAKVAKKIAPIVLPIVAPFLLPAMPLAFATGIGSLAGGLIAGQDFSTALKGAVITGGLAGLGNMAFGGSEGFGSGSFFGSRAAPSQGLGTFGFKDAFTPVNPFSQAGQAQLSAFQQQAAQQAAGTAAPGTAAVQQPASGDVAQGKLGEKFDFKPLEGVEPEKTLFGDLKKTVMPGDNYDALDLYGDYVSPSRSGIQPTGTELGTETARLTNAQISQAQAANEAIKAAGLTPAPIDVAGIQKAAMEQAATNLAPSAISKYAPLAAISTGTALAADYATDGAVLGMFTDDDGDGLDDTTGYTMEDYKVMFPNAFYDQSKFYGDNKYYQDPTFRTDGQAIQQSYMGPITVASGGEIMGPGTPTSDSIPAMLSDGEFVMNARAVRGAGGGDRKDGAKKMYAMMRDFERRA